MVALLLLLLLLFLSFRFGGAEFSFWGTTEEYWYYVETVPLRRVTGFKKMVYPTETAPNERIDVSTRIQQNGKTSTIKNNKPNNQLRWCTYNVRHSGNGRLQQVLKSCNELRIDFGILTETKISNEHYPRRYADYDIKGTVATNVQGGVLVFWRSNPSGFSIESIVIKGKNVLSFIIVSGALRWKVIGCYLPPSEDDALTLQEVAREVNTTKNMPVIVAGDLNVDLRRHINQSTRDAAIATTLASCGLDDMSRHFYQRRRHKEGYTWRQRREGRIVRARNDAILSDERKWFQKVAIVEPPGCDSDHYMLVATITTQSLHEHKAYLNGRKKIDFPSEYDFGPTNAIDEIFTSLQQQCLKRINNTNPKTSDWISNRTWRLMRRRTALKRIHSVAGIAKRKELKRKIRSSLARDRKARAQQAGVDIETALKSGDARGGFNIAKRWYRNVTGRPPPPAREDMEVTAATFEKLYSKNDPAVQFEVPTGLRGQIGVNDTIPTVEEIIDHAKRLHYNKAPGLSGMRSEDVKGWARTFEATDPKLRQDLPFSKLVTLVQQAFISGTLPKYAYVSILVLIPKANSYEYRGIGLLEVVWKLISAIIDTRLKKGIEFQPEIHGFRPGYGTGTAILSNKLSLQKACVSGESLKQVYLDLSKAYDTLNRDTTMAILKSYGVGERIGLLLNNFWKHHHVIPRASGYYGRCFRSFRGVTQGDIVSPMIFNIVVDCLIQKWKAEDTGVDKVSAIFYADDGVLSSYDAVQLQLALDWFTHQFHLLGLKMNSQKTKTLISTPGHIPIGLSTPAYKFRMTGIGASEQARRALRITCPTCRREMRASSLRRHMESVHQEFSMPQQAIAKRLFDETSGTMYQISVPKGRRDKVLCPVPECPGTATNGYDMRKHFMKRHPKDSIVIEEEGPLPRCELCGMFVKEEGVATHGNTKLCQDAQRTLARRKQVERVYHARQLDFMVGEDTLEKVDSFLYLGRWVQADDSDLLAVYSNIRKARGKWQSLARVLVRERASPKVTAIFYKAVVLAVLLYGCETWTISDQIYKILNAFHVTTSRQIARLQIRFDAKREIWIYPSLTKVFRRTGLSPMYDYLLNRRQYILPFAETLSTFGDLAGLEKKTQRQLWITDSDLEGLALKQAYKETFERTRNRMVNNDLSVDSS
jgi:Reverse transcriptase (RNA-dependent DNA polymerase)/Endonuclease/Exonuclease/phosphatase family